jgi:hypothetical protein
MAAPWPPRRLLIMAGCVIGGALGALIYRAIADNFDEGRLAGAIAGARAYAQGYRAAVPGRPAE